MMQDGESPASKGQPGVTQAALFGLCPACSARTLWQAPAAFAPRCRACGTDFAAHEPHGRTLFLVVLPVTVILVAAALKLDDALRPALWVQAALWGTLVPLAMIGALRLAKTAALRRALDRRDQP
ncbi:DUF983 domain-containing protein [Novosphingobium olei]|uniref:DUF983 domain-containing protein n=1 Tax=Novosphingobium olei TaxID=2728851 RepID=UPI003088A847|nr:DUF983 domain-containing protein [Novosphingobium olei]